MKKNIAMRVAAFLFILTMISTCAFATTFAKYTTTDEAHDSARVAKWGVKVEVENKDGSFQTKYDVADADADKTVASANGTDTLVAPGTEGDLVTFNIEGTPEVSVSVEINFTLDIEGWEAKGAYYCPIVITYNLGSGNQYIKGLDYTSEEDFEDAINDAITAAYNAKPNTTLDKEIIISWAWAISGTVGTEASQTDELDTALGNLGTAPTISFTADCTVEQIGD